VSAYHEAVLEHSREGHVAPFVFAGVANSEAMAEDTRRSVFATISSQILGPFRYDLPHVSAVFSAAQFVGSWGTVYVTIPPERAESTQALVAAFVESLTAAWRTTSHRTGTLLLALDEVANVAPLPNLPKLITAGAGDGIQCLLGMQDPNQAKRWTTDAGVVTGGTTHVALYKGLREDAYLTGVARLSSHEMQYEIHVKVVGEPDQAPRLASDRRLIEERQALEAALEGVEPRRRRIVAKQVAVRLARARLRQGIRSRTPEAEGPADAVLKELLAYTSVQHVPSRRPKIEASKLAQGRLGAFFLLTGAHGDFRDFAHWREDPFWSAIMADGSRPLA
jgi:hypothetical protein